MSLIAKLDYPAFDYASRQQQYQRLRFVIEHCGNQIPRIFIAIMFGRHPESVTQRLRRTFPQRTRSDGASLFASWIREDRIGGLAMLSRDERRYLRRLRRRVVAEYNEQRFRDPQAVAERLAEELRLAAKRVAKSVPRATCSRDECTNSFPKQGRFFPNIAKGGKRPGRCAVCTYLQKAQTSRRRESFLYWVNQSGVACCADATTGNLVYEQRLDLKGNRDKVYASLVLGDGKLYGVSREDGAFVLAARPDFELLARNHLGDSSIFNATPTISNGELLVRSDRYLYCIGD